MNYAAYIILRMTSSTSPRSFSSICTFAGKHLRKFLYSTNMCTSYTDFVFSLPKLSTNSRNIRIWVRNFHFFFLFFLPPFELAANIIIVRKMRTFFYTDLRSFLHHFSSPIFSALRSKWFCCSLLQYSNTIEVNQRWGWRIFK